jgi:hypothetical protein
VKGGIRRERKVVFGVFEWLTIWQMFKEGLANVIKHFSQIRRDSQRSAEGGGGRRARWRYRRAVDVL